MKKLTLNEMFAQAAAQAAVLVAARRAEAPAGFDVFNGFTPDTPPPRNLGPEYTDTLNAQIGNAPRVFGAEAAFRPRYQALQQQDVNQNVFGTGGQAGLLDLYRTGSAVLGRTQNDANAYQHAGDISQIYGFGAQGRDALRQLNPDNAGLLDQLNAQASGDLAAGSHLNAGDLRNVQQGSRAASQARGLNFSPSAAADEVLRTALAGQAQQDRRRGFASQVYGLNQNSYTDPLLSILGRQSNAIGQASNLYNQAASSAGTAGPRIFNPESAYASDLYNTNYNAKAAAQIAGANNTAAVVGAGLSAL